MSAQILQFPPDRFRYCIEVARDGQWHWCVYVTDTAAQESALYWCNLPSRQAALAKAREAATEFCPASFFDPFAPGGGAA